jgi:hypothetical protein
VLLQRAQSNLIDLLPMMVLTAAWVRYGVRSVAVIERIKSRVSRFFADRRWSLVLALVGVCVVAWTVVTS